MSVTLPFTEEAAALSMTYLRSRSEPNVNGAAMYASIDAHLQWCELRNLRESTIRHRRGILERLAVVVGDPVAATDEDLFAWWVARKLKANSRAAELGHLASFYRWAVRARLRDDDPTVRLPRPKLPPGLPRPASEDDVARALERAPRPVLDWLTLAGYAGLRACEIAPLAADDYDGDRIAVRDGKGGHCRVVPVHPKIVALAADWPTVGLLWGVNAHGRPYSANLVSQATNRWLRAEGIHSTLHQWRHRFGTAAYRAHRDVRAVQELLGHASLSTTQRYVSAASDAGRRAVLSLD